MLGSVLLIIFCGIIIFLAWLAGHGFVELFAELLVFLFDPKPPKLTPFEYDKFWREYQNLPKANEELTSYQKDLFYKEQHKLKINKYRTFNLVGESIIYDLTSQEELLVIISKNLMVCVVNPDVNVVKNLKKGDIYLLDGLIAGSSRGQNFSDGYNREVIELRQRSSFRKKIEPLF